jgi:hypothetical protein
MDLSGAGRMIVKKCDGKFIQIDHDVFKATDCFSWRVLIPTRMLFRVVTGANDLFRAEDAFLEGGKAGWSLRE